MRTRARIALAAGLLLAALPAFAQTADPLLDGFRDPPDSARPRAWWHWLNGNITEEGIDKDLEWMKAAGLGGVQNFNASLGTPQIVETRLPYMSDGWKRAFAHAIATADRLGLEFAIAASPGWSETGGPWVPPADAMKKLVWASVDVPGGKRFKGALPAPPSTTGPYGTTPFADALAGIGGATPPPPPSAHGEVAVLAYPVGPADAAVLPAAAAQDGQLLDATALGDAREDTVAKVPIAAKGATTIATLRFAAPRNVRSATVFVPGAIPPFGMPAYAPVLEVETGEGWQKLADVPMARVPTTIAFAPVTASGFRLRFAAYVPDRPPAIEPPAPGAVTVDPFAKPPATTIDLATFALSGEPRVDRFEAKAGFATVGDYHALARPLPDDGAATPGQVVDLTARLAPDGTLDWTPPPGRWRVMRFGWSLLGTTNHPAAPEATGLEVDKYDGGAVRRYFDRYLATYAEAQAFGAGGRGLDALLTDSIEAGDANWTPRLIEQFKRLRGYDPMPWLPALSGAVIGSRAQSDAFLYDYRRTLADLLATEHYGTAAKIAHERGLIIYSEALEDQRPQLGDDLSMRAFADVPMAAMWAYPHGGAPRPTLVGDDLGAASVANLYGKRYVAAESLTAFLSPWAFAPADLRHIADMEFVLGINRPVIHTSPHSPPDDKLPGLSLAIFGQYFNRHESWASMARPWVDYLARTGFLLQQGRHAADVAYFIGEEAPLTQLYADGRIGLLPTTHGFDFVDAKGLRDALSPRDGALEALSGTRYRLLYLGGTSQQMTLATLQRVAALAEAGATIVGEAPRGSPSLADDAGAFRALVARLWPGGPETQVGAGRVIATRDLDAALARVGVAPDFAAATPAGEKPLLFLHRALDDGSQIYFVTNRSTAARSATARFRVTGLAPELWHADTGTAEPLSYTTDGAQTLVPLDLGPESSALIVFRQRTGATERKVPEIAKTDFGTLDGPWHVGFEAGRGAPASIELPALAPLETNADPAIRYFSGIATYSRSLEPPRGWKPGTPLWLDLGRVGDLAEVRVNGKPAGTMWHAPYRVDIGPLLTKGANQLEVRVANLWVNRLIGDAQPGAAKVTFVAAPTYSPDAPLRPSGLIGPVTLTGVKR